MRQSKAALARSISGAALAGAIATMLSAPAAMAQEGAASNDGMIIVTARFEEEDIQDVPLPITAFDAETLERRNVTELDDVARFTAGFAFEDFDGGNANPSIRGQSTLRTTGREQTVAAFLDGVYLPRSWVVDLGTANMQRIEIVKGPQSSRYGRNAFAGAINYISKRPSGDFGVDVSATVGNYDRFDIGGGIEFPIIDDRLALRLAYEHTEFDGSWENSHPNADIDLPIGSTGRIGGYDNDAWSALLVFEPTDNIEVELAYNGYDKSEESRAANFLNTGRGDGNCGSLQVGDNPSLFCGTFGVEADTVTLDPRGFGRQADIDVIRGSVTIEPTDSLTLFYQFGQIWGETLTANSAESDPVGCGTILGPPVFPTLCNFQAAPLGNIDYRQHELRLSFDDGGMFRGSIGGFYMEGDDEAFSISANAPPLGTAPLALDPLNSTSFPDLSNFVFNAEQTETEVKSVFAEVTLSFNDDRTRISAEGRYTDEQITTVSTLGGGVAPIGDETFDFFTPRFTVEHELSPDSLLYATVARGAKAGGFNPGAVTPALRTYDPEFNWTYELGLKNTLLNGDLTLNLAAFYTDWSALQITITDPAGGIFTPVQTANLGDARIIGMEAEGAWQASDNISFDFAISYTDAEYKDGTTDAQFIRGDGRDERDPPEPVLFPAPCDGTVCAADGEIGGNPLERSPKWQLALGAQFEEDFDDDWSFYIRSDVAYQSDYSAYAIATAFAPERTVVHARAAVEYQDMIELSIWARNLFDEKYVSNALGIIQPFSNNILLTYYGDRRTIGATVSFTY